MYLTLNYVTEGTSPERKQHKGYELLAIARKRAKNEAGSPSGTESAKTSHIRNRGERLVGSTPSRLAKKYSPHSAKMAAIQTKLDKYK